MINAGVQGYGPVEELLFFRRVARALQPDLVIETIFVGNDAEEAVALGGAAAPGRRAASDGAAARTLVDAAAPARAPQHGAAGCSAARDRRSPIASRARSAPPEPPLQSYAAHAGAAHRREGWRITRECVAGDRGGRRAPRARGPAVVLMPARFQVDDADYGRLRETVAQAGGELVRDAREPPLRRGARRRCRLPRFDVLPALRARAAGPDLFFQQTVHLTPRGHEVVAAALERFLDARACSTDRRRALIRPRWSSTPLHFVWFFLVVYAVYRLLPHRGAELAAARRELLLLRGLGLALPRAARRVDARRLHAAASWLGREPIAGAAGALLLCLSLGFNLTLLGFFKYFNFFADNLHALFAALGWQLDFVTLRVLLPVGISFYTFVTMSYVIDVYRREIPPTRNLRGLRASSSRTSRTWSRGRSCARRALLPQIARGRAAITREQMRDGALAHRVGVLPEDLRRRQPRRRSSTRCSSRARTRPASTSCSAPTRSRSRSTATSPATRTSRAARRS